MQQLQRGVDYEGGINESEDLSDDDQRNKKPQKQAQN